MITSDLNKHFREALRDIERLSKAIGERGYDDIQEDWDDYSLLLQSHEFKQLVTLELYEATFRPNVMSLNSSY